jgi:Arc/MetJ-type ribon-helix-helix transcriptional regulator
VKLTGYIKSVYDPYMAIVNFSIPKNLEKRVEDTVRQKGFASKAEFFRFAAIYFMDILGRRAAGNEEERFKHLTGTLNQEISERYRGEKIPSAKDQLADM